MSDSPLVSVLMTSFNREKYIGDAIASVLASSYQNFELIISDDCSTDNTVSIAKNYAAKDVRVKVFVNEQNLSDYKNRNRAASYATGKYIKYLDSDDLIYAWGLEAMVNCMEKFPAAGFGLMSYGLSQAAPYPVLSWPQESYKAFFFKNALIAMGPSGAIIRTDVFNQLGGFTGEPFIGDTELWLRAGALYPLVRMPIDLIWWREHEGQQMRDEIKDKFISIKRMKIFKAAVLNQDCPLDDFMKKTVIRNLENVRIRDILVNHILKLKIADSISLMKYAGFSFFDLWKALRKNKYPA